MAIEASVSTVDATDVRRGWNIPSGFSPLKFISLHVPLGYHTHRRSCGRGAEVQMHPKGRNIKQICPVPGFKILLLLTSILHKNALNYPTDEGTPFFSEEGLCPLP